MISFELGVTDLADTRFAVSPLGETMLSLRVLREPGLSPLHLPWRRWALPRIDPEDLTGLLAVVGPRLTLPDFLTARPPTSVPAFADELAAARAVAPGRVRHDLRLAHSGADLPSTWRGIDDDAGAAAVRDLLCDRLERYWASVIAAHWPSMLRVAEADMTYRARRLALGGARALFADLHPHVRFTDDVLHVTRMISDHRVHAAGRGLLLVPSVFAHQPAPPAAPDEPPSLIYPCRGAATLWDTPVVAGPAALTDLLGATRARLLALLDEPLPTVEIARRFRVSASAVSQHLQVLHATGLLTKARAGRHVLYRRSDLGDRLIGRAGESG